MRTKDGGERADFEVPPKSPLRDGMLGLQSMIAIATGKRDSIPRYQLVDDGVPGDVPILHSPGQIKKNRVRKNG